MLLVPCFWDILLSILQALLWKNSNTGDFFPGEFFSYFLFLLRVAVAFLAPFFWWGPPWGLISCTCSLIRPWFSTTMKPFHFFMIQVEFFYIWGIFYPSKQTFIAYGDRSFSQRKTITTPPKTPRLHNTVL